MKNGFTFIEMSIVMAIGATLFAAQASSARLSHIEEKSALLGKEIYEFNKAISQYLKGEEEHLRSGTWRFGGSKWLHSSTCDGVSPVGYLHCDFIESNTTRHYSSMPHTTIKTSSDRVLEATIVWSDIDVGLEYRDFIKGVASMIASGAQVVDYDSKDEYSSNTVFCPDVVTFSPAIENICKDNRGHIVSRVIVNRDASSGTDETRLSVNHTNLMEKFIEFDNGSGKTTPESGPGFSLDDIDGSTLRQIVNVQRIYNLGSGNNDSLILGRRNGESIYSDSFITANNLLKESVIIDGDLAVMNDFYVRGNIVVNGKAEIQSIATNELTVERDIEAGGSLKIKDNAIIEGDLQVSGDSLVKGKIKTNNNLYVDKNAIVLGNMTTWGDGLFAEDVLVKGDLDSRNLIVRSTIDTAWLNVNETIQGKKIYGSHSMRTEGYLSGVKGVLTNGSINAKGNLLLGGTLQITSPRTEGEICNVEGLISRTSGGKALNCFKGKWVSLYNQPNSCVWRDTGKNSTFDHQYHSIRCNAGEVVTGWRGYSQDAIEGNISVYCCSL